MKKSYLTATYIIAAGAINALTVLLLPEHYYFSAPVTAAVLFIFLHKSFPFDISPVPLKANAACGFLSAAPLFLSLISERSPDNINIFVDERLCFFMIFTITAAVNCLVYGRIKGTDGRTLPLSRSIWIFLLNVTAFCIGIAVFIPVGAVVIIGYAFLGSL